MFKTEQIKKQNRQWLITDKQALELLCVEYKKLSWNNL